MTLPQKMQYGNYPFLPPEAACDDTMKIVITRTGATIIAAFTIAICNRLETVWDYSTNHLVTFNYRAVSSRLLPSPPLPPKSCSESRSMNLFCRKSYSSRCTSCEIWYFLSQTIPCLFSVEKFERTPREMSQQLGILGQCSRALRAPFESAWSQSKSSL